MTVEEGTIKAIGNSREGVDRCPDSRWRVPRIGRRIDRDGGVRVSCYIVGCIGARQKGDGP